MASGKRRVSRERFCVHCPLVACHGHEGDGANLPAEPRGLSGTVRAADWRHTDASARTERIGQSLTSGEEPEVGIEGMGPNAWSDEMTAANGLHRVR